MGQIDFFITEINYLGDHLQRRRIFGFSSFSPWSLGVTAFDKPVSGNLLTHIQECDWTGDLPPGGKKDLRQVISSKDILSDLFPSAIPMFSQSSGMNSSMINLLR